MNYLKNLAGQKWFCQPIYEGQRLQSQHNDYTGTMWYHVVSKQDSQADGVYLSIRPSTI